MLLTVERQDMTYTSEVAGAIVLSPFDLRETAGIAPHGCEDCACSVSESLQTRTWPPPIDVSRATEWVCGREIIRIQVSDDYHLLFNPLGSNGPVVVNQHGLSLFQRFSRPATLAGARVAGPDRESGAQYVFDRL